jgi:methylthioribulose-1-phosphate dehydratase
VSLKSYFTKSPWPPFENGTMLVFPRNTHVPQNGVLERTHGRYYNSRMTSSEHLAQLGREFHRRGWALGTSGNFSAVVSRDPLRIAITASSLDKGQLTAEQILEIDSNGSVMPPTAGKPSAETLLHVAIVRSLGAGAVLHTHSVWSTILSDYHKGQGGFFIEGYEMLKGLSGVATHEHREWIPIVENSQDMNMLSGETTRMLEENPGVHGFLIRRHGMYTWGKDLAEAARHVEILEFLLESVGRRQMMEPQY